MNASDIMSKPLNTIARALRDGSVSAGELAAAAIARHDAVGETFNAYLTWDADVPRKMAAAADAALAAGCDLGPLQGLPISIKDLYGIEGFPTYAGSGKRLPEKWEAEGPVVQGIKAQLGVITGKTHTVEFAAGGLGTNIHWGAPRNPWDAEVARSPGGSSAGAGVSLWEGSAVAAFGSDTMGSVRIPATATGVVGLKIGAHRWSNAGIVPLRASQDTPGPLTRTAADAAYVFAALDPAHRGDPAAFLESLDDADISGLTIGIADASFWEGCDPGITETVQGAVAELEKAGARVIDAPSPETAELLEVVMRGEMLNVELLVFLEEELPGWLDQVDPSLQARLESSRGTSAIELISRQRWLDDVVARAQAAFPAVDALVAPTLCVTPPVVDPPPPPSNQPPIVLARNTCVANFFVQCAISLPVGLDAENMPVGLQFTAPGGAEDHLLGVAMAAERVLGTGIDRIGMPPMLG
ncbi:MAG: amidase [Rhodospirillales bacterium]|jgi:aspartyl-tRNA(Asn)/glutamyl-tRNA(Gln) amidotransferase subunit A|nr:amidase [Rhodospirillales bacterium]MDP6646225.1 amidase [Rhodospirillales bacterium]